MAWWPTASFIAVSACSAVPDVENRVPSVQDLGRRLGSGLYGPMENRVLGATCGAIASGAATGGAAGARAGSNAARRTSYPFDVRSRNASRVPSGDTAGADASPITFVSCASAPRSRSSA